MSTITQPKVPSFEEDPRIRFNMMLKIIDDWEAENIDRAEIRGLYHEAWTAKHLIESHYILHGNQISRHLTKAESEQGLNGDSQKIHARQDGRSRELDMLCIMKDDRQQDITWIVEAKDTQRSDTHQLPANLELGMELGYRVLYVLASQAPGRKQALLDAYAVAQLHWQGKLPPLRIVQTARPFGTLVNLTSLEEITDESFNCDDGGFP